MGFQRLVFHPIEILRQAVICEVLIDVIPHFTYLSVGEDIVYLISALMAYPYSILGLSSCDYRFKMMEFEIGVILTASLAEDAEVHPGIIPFWNSL